MSTKEFLHAYFSKVNDKADWQTMISDDIRFESPSQTTIGKDAYVTAASRFFQMAETLEIKQLVVEGEMASAWVNYSLCLKNGKRFTCQVAELLEVKNNRLVSSIILFDTFALRTFTSQN
jgi:hypothetical protein